MYLQLYFPQVAIELEYAKSMFEQHKKAHPNDEIVGWLVPYLHVYHAGGIYGNIFAQP